MARIFAVDVLECPRCGGRMRILAAIEDPSVARRISKSNGMPEVSGRLGEVSRPQGGVA